MTSVTSVTSRATRLLAPNPSPMTLDGTNTWLLAEPGASAAVVVDPGPADPGHLRSIVAAAGHRGLAVSLVLLTHGHPDHSAGADAFAELTGAPVRAADPAFCRDAPPLTDRAAVDVDGLHLRTIPTPGHTADSVCFLIPADAALLTGDTVLGRGTTVVAHPDGRLAPYLASLEQLHELAGDGTVRTVLPGHGPVITDPGTVLAGYLAHRAERLRQVRAALAAGDLTAADVVRRVYADVDRALWPFAEMSVRAQIEYLRPDG